jgi:hypothetical protein
LLNDREVGDTMKRRLRDLERRRKSDGIPNANHGNNKQTNADGDDGFVSQILTSAPVRFLREGLFGGDVAPTTSDDLHKFFDAGGRFRNPNRDGADTTFDHGLGGHLFGQETIEKRRAEFLRSSDVNDSGAADKFDYRSSDSRQGAERKLQSTATSDNASSPSHTSGSKPTASQHKTADPVDSTNNLNADQQNLNYNSDDDGHNTQFFHYNTDGQWSLLAIIKMYCFSLQHGMIMFLGRMNSPGVIQNS